MRFVAYLLLPLGGVGGGLCSCSDFFDQESDRVIYSNVDHIDSWVDTTYSVAGILNKLQAIADRTILLGEVRGDLVSLTSAANSDLRDMSTFSMNDDNIYNQPRDYYAVINNCNYFLAHADTALKSNRNQYIFMKEYAAVKSIRAWTYLQLALNYGSVPFVTEPITTKDESVRDYPRMELADICQYFINDLASLPERYDYEYPDYGTNVRGNYSRMLFFPLNVVRGDLYLWLGSTMGLTGGQDYFRRAALCYHQFLKTRNGLDTNCPTGTDYCIWMPGTTTWDEFFTFCQTSSSGFLMSTGGMANTNYSLIFSNEAYYSEAELITMIPGDSIPAEGNYSELRNLFNSNSDNDYKVSITPSQALFNLSESQANVALSSNLKDPTYSPSDLTNHRRGDLRLSCCFYETEMSNSETNTRMTVQQIYKYRTRNVHIYRKQMVYLRLAEALNLAGYPRLAYKILERGLTTPVIRKEVYPYLDKADSTWVATNLSFPSSLKVINVASLLSPNDTCNTIGIHSRGSGWTPLNDEYRLDGEEDSCYVMQPDSTFIFDAARYEALKTRQMAQVDSLILNENALECCFEGTRYYDLMRFAMRSDNPGKFMSERLNRSELNDRKKWYMSWKGQIGF